MAFVFGFTGIARCCLGLWQFLTARANGRASVELERERNRGTAEAIKLLPPGAELLENEPTGRLRVIRMPQSHIVPMPTSRWTDTGSGSAGEITK